MAIDQANTSGDSLARTEALRQAILVLHSPLVHERSNGSLIEEVERKLAMWRGLCHVTLVVEEMVICTDSASPRRMALARPSSTISDVA
jgi:hypothetical protein